LTFRRRNLFDKATDFKLLLEIIEGLPAADDPAPN